MQPPAASKRATMKLNGASELDCPLCVRPLKALVFVTDRFNFLSNNNMEKTLQRNETFLPFVFVHLDTKTWQKRV